MRSPLRSPSARAGRSSREPRRVRPPLLLGAAHARLAEPHRDHATTSAWSRSHSQSAGSSSCSAAATGWLRCTAGLVASFVVGFLFALPSPVAGISMPSKLLWHVLPAFRVPSRWDPLLMTALLPLAALGLQTVRRVAGVAVVVVAMGLSFFELATHRVAHFRTVPVPPEYTALERDTAERDPRRVPAGLLGHLPPLAARARPAARERSTRRIRGRPGTLHGPRPCSGGNGAGVGAARRHGSRHPPWRPGGHASAAARPGNRHRVIASSAVSRTAPPSGPSSRRLHRRS